MSPASLAPGTVIDGYRIQGVLGAGGAGTVHAAFDSSRGTPVAFKILDPRGSVDPSAVARFEREARLAGSLRHPNIVEVLASGSLSDGRPYLVMPLLEGRSLREELAISKRLDPARAWRIARALADALRVAHDAGIIHRDVKPENVFLEHVGSNERVVLLDFGVAKIASVSPSDLPLTGADKLTKTGVPVGTPAYMAPEQWWGDGVGPATDQYGLGATLFEMLAGRPPFATSNLAQLVQDHVDAKPPSLLDAGADAGIEVEALVARLLAKTPGDRFPSMRAVEEAGDVAFGASLPVDLASLPTALPTAPPEPAAPLALSPGALVPSVIVAGRYRLDRLLGEGGMGQVWAATHAVTGRAVALKLLRGRLADRPDLRERFAREARAASSVDHPNVIAIHDFFTLDDQTPVMVMDLLAGESLRARLERSGALSVVETAGILAAVASAVSAAHALGIVHRDLKPDNVFLAREPAKDEAREVVKVLDFGIAKLRGPAFEATALAGSGSLTSEGTVMGTPWYMAPEQASGERDVDQRADVFSIGVLLYECLAGRRPFRGETLGQLLKQILKAEVTPLAEVAPGVPAELSALVMRMLSAERDARPASLGEVLDVLRPLAVSTPSLEPAPAPASKPGLGRYLAILAAIFALGFAGLVAVGYAGEARHVVKEWVIIAGWGAWLVLATLPLGVAGLVLLAMRRLRGVAGSSLGLWIPLASAVAGAAGTYTGWREVLRYLHQVAELRRLSIVSEGTYEANSARFLGFSIATLLALGLAALPSPSAGLPRHPHGRREALAAALVLTIIAVAAGILGAPSGVLIASVGAAVALLSLVPAASLPKPALERAAAGIFAVLFASATALARLEARESVLWAETPTRAARVAEIIGAQAERQATVPIAVFTLLVLAALEGLRLRRALRAHGAPLGKPGAGVWALGLVLVAAATFDVVQHGVFIGKRDELRASMADQFALFARLDPPSGDGLDPKRFPPHKGTSLQVARESVAIDSKGVARLAALASPESSAQVLAELNRALAKMDGLDEPNEARASDLSLFIDREVKGESVSRVFQLARSAGVRRVELVLTRGASPVLGPSAPAEARVVLPADFVAIPCDLDPAGEPLDGGATFGDLARGLVARAAAGETPRLRAP